MPTHPPPLRLTAGLILLATAASSVRGNELLLRDFSRIRGVSLRGFDEDGVVLQDGRRFGWDQIQRGTVSAGRQADFDRLLEELGEPLFRIRKRLAAGDYRELSDAAESLYPRYRGRQGTTAYVVCQAVMWSRQARGLREASVEPYLHCFRYLREMPADEIDLPGDRRLAFDPLTGMTPDLMPVWFDPEAAGQALPGVLQAVSELPEPRPEGTRVYYGTLALAAGKTDEARRVLSGIVGRQPVLASLREIALARLAVAEGNPREAIQRLGDPARETSPETRPLKYYGRGRARLQFPERETKLAGLLDLMVVPAVYGERHPELAAAALYQSAATFAALGQPEDQAAVRRELLDRYGQTYHAARMRDDLSPKKDP